MIYLLAKYTLLFLLTAALGFILGYWWSRRNFVDVSESYEDLRVANERSEGSNWSQLWQRFDSIPLPEKIDLSNVFQRLDDVENAVAGIPKPEPVSLTGVESGLQKLTDRVESIPAPVAPKEPDFHPVIERIEKLERGIQGIPAPADLAPVSTRLERVEELVRNLPAPEPQKDVDLQPLASELTGIRGDINDLPKATVDLQPVNSELRVIRDEIKGLPRERVDLQPLTRQIETVEKRVGSIRQPEAVDLKPIDRRLKAIESEIGKLGKKLKRQAPKQTRKVAKPRSTKASKPRTRKATQQRSEPRILSGAIHGRKDDLKRISGVGPMLEQLLNKNGIYYFWQVATWSARDINVMDDRLDVFKGRISRDNWVAQARQLRQSEGAAKMPADQ